VAKDLNFAIINRLLPTGRRPICQRPFSAGPAGFASVLALGGGFLTAGSAGVAVCDAAVRGTGWVCVQAGTARHDRTAATAKGRTMKILHEDRNRRNGFGEWVGAK